MPHRSHRSLLYPSSTLPCPGAALSCISSQACLTLPCPDAFGRSLAVGLTYFALSSPFPHCLLFGMPDPALSCCALPESYLARPDLLPSGASQHPSSTAGTEAHNARAVDLRVALS